MRAVKGIFLGVIFGFCLSLFVPFTVIAVFQMLIGGVYSMFVKPWIYSITVIPFTFTFAILGYIFSKEVAISNKELWLYSVFSASYISFYSGTIGRVFGYLAQGYDLSTVSTTFDVQGTMINGAILALILLPLSILLQRYALKLFLLLFKKSTSSIKSS